MSKFQVIINDQLIKGGEILPIDLTKAKPKIRIPHNGDKYTVIMVDPDAPSPKDAKYKYWLHWITINNGETLMEFEPPKPPLGSGKHRYYFFLYKQKNKLDKNNINKITKRNNFQITDFAFENGLEEIDYVYFMTENKN